jgi:glycosyltransferase involved in cell wall biosynthesis
VSYRLVSIVLPVHRQADHIASVVEEYQDRLATLGLPHETILVANGPPDGSLEACRTMEVKYSAVRAVAEPRAGWGRAVRRGLREVSGDLVCYTNSARTSAADLIPLILYAVANPDVVIKANRRIRESWRRRMSSLVYNLECRSLFDRSCWDINGRRLPIALVVVTYAPSGIGLWNSAWFYYEEPATTFFVLYAPVALIRGPSQIRVLVFVAAALVQASSLNYWTTVGFSAFLPVRMPSCFGAT